MIVPMDTAAERQLLHRGAKFDFEVVTVRGRDGKSLRREVVRHPGAVVILPLVDRAHLALIRNRRIALGTTLWELPAGTIEAGEPPDRCAARELTEETGYAAGRLRPLGRFFTTPGMTDELMHAFVATDLQPVGQTLENDEEIDVHVVPVAEAMAMIDRGAAAYSGHQRST